MHAAPNSTPASPPRLVRAMTERPINSASDASAASAVSAASANPDATNPQDDVMRTPVGEFDTQSTAAASSSSALKGRARRVRTRSVSSHAIPVTQLTRSTLSPLRVQLDTPLDRGPGTPDFTLSPSTPQWRRADLERDSTMSSLGHGLQLISDAQTSAGPLSSPAAGRPRSHTNASHSSDSSDSHKKKTAPFLSRPRLSTLRSLFSSFSASNSAANSRNTPNTPHTEHPASQHDPDRVTPQPLVMPSARPAAPNGLIGLNQDSPPLTPTSDLDEQSEYQQYVHAFRHQFVPKHPTKHHAARKHQWSAAQAAADAADAALAHMHESNRITPPAPSQSSLTPPLTTSNATSPGASTRAFSPPTRPDSTLALPNAYQGILPSHLASDGATSSRSTTPTSSTATSASDRTTSTYNLFDVDTYRIQSVANTLFALVPRIQINLSSWRLSMPNLRPYLPRLFFLFGIFVASTCCIVFMLSTLPLTLPKHITTLTLAEIKQLAMSLRLYSQSSTTAFVHTLVVLGTFFTWKQSFTVPGSLIMNVVFGAMYGTYSGTLYTSVLTAVGGVFCYLLSAPLAPLITSLPGLAKPLDAMRRALSPGRARASGRSVMIANTHTGSDGNVWTYLLVLRVLPIVPYGLMNIACGVLGVPLAPYAGTLAIGSIPWNFVTCQVGDLLQEIVEALPTHHDTPASAFNHHPQTGAGGGMRAIVHRIWNREMVVKLVLLSLASLLPIVLSRYLKYRQTRRDEAHGYVRVVGEDDDDVVDVDDEESDRVGFRRSWRNMLPTETVALGEIAAQSGVTPSAPSVSRSNTISNAWL